MTEITISDYTAENSLVYYSIENMREIWKYENVTFVDGIIASHHYLCGIFSLTVSSPKPNNL